MGICKDLVGQVFGELTVLQKTSNRASNGGVYWLCQCSCGKTKEILGQSLKSGKTISCGCVRLKKLEIGRGLNFHDLTGKVFGKLTVIKRIEDKELNGRFHVQWECVCECGNTTNVLSSNLVTGNSQSCGLCGNNSHGNIKIAALLTSANIPYEREKCFKDCKDTSQLPFDFFVNNSYLIEYDGRQHFNKNTFYYNEKIPIHDHIKSQWCIENNIPLIRIPYTHYNDLCIQDLLLETSTFIETPTINRRIKREG